MQLQTQKDGAAALGMAIVSKVPAIGQSIAQQSIGQINTVLDTAIKAYGAPAAAGTAAGAGAGKAGNATAATPAGTAEAAVASKASKHDVEPASVAAMLLV